MREVHYHVTIDRSKAQVRRFAKACEACKVPSPSINDHGRLIRLDSIVYLRPSQLNKFRQLLGGKYSSVRYVSPSEYFDGEFVSIFESAEDELSGRKSERYIMYQEKKDEHDRSKQRPGS